MAHHPHHAQPAAPEPSASLAGVLNFSTDCGPLLFPWWHPKTPGSYWLSLGALLVLGALSEWLAARARVGAAQSSVSPDELTRICDEDMARSKPAPGRTRNLAGDLREGMLHFVSIAMNYCLMLLTMTFNVGVCVAVVLGITISRTMRSRL